MILISSWFRLRPHSLSEMAPRVRLNIKTVFPRYGDSHVKDKTVATVLTLTWGSLYGYNDIFSNRDGPHGRSRFGWWQIKRLRKELCRLFPGPFGGSTSLQDSWTARWWDKGADRQRSDPRRDAAGERSLENWKKRKNLTRIYTMTSSNWNIFRVTGLCDGNLPVTGEFPS